MRILYASTMVSENTLQKLLKDCKVKPLQSIQKFHRLVCEGLSLNGINVTTMTIIPVSSSSHRKIFWNEKNEQINGIKYNYLPFINLPILKIITTVISSIFNVLIFKIKKKEDKIIICDILNGTVSCITLMLSKILRISCIAIVTDLPVEINPKGIKGKLYKLLLKNIGSKYDGYILITEEMNKIINPKNRPYMVMEGLVDCSMKKIKSKIEDKYDERVIIYAGGLYEKYGVKTLIDAFLKIKDANLKLWLYGSGDLDEYIKKIKDDRVKFYGVVENSLIVKEEIKATLLINPRFTNNEYTKYSFPSKNMEYMVSGTPLLTTKLPGMPKEYYDYVYFIENETIEGFKESLEKHMNIPKKDLFVFGTKAKRFVLENKNNIFQSKKISDFIKECMKI